MSGAQKSRGSSSGEEESRSTPDILISESDERFFQSLREFIEHEKQYLQCPPEGADELRYIIYRSVFNKVIGRATTYKRLLLTIKAGYDDVIRALQSREDKARMAQRAVTASTSQPKSVLTCRRRAAQLRDRVSVLQRETSELQEEIRRRRCFREQNMWIPGVTLAESEDPEALDGHLKRLEAHRDALLDTKSRCVPLEVKDELDAELQDAERRRDRLNVESRRLRVQFQRLGFLSDRLSSWQNEEQQVPLEELVGSTLENIREADETDAAAAELFVDEEPSGADESRLLTDHLDRFSELLNSARYDEAALLAAASPRGVLRNLEAMEMFEGVKGPPGSAPPPLLFSQALMMTVTAGDEPSAALSLRLVVCVLQHGDAQLVRHAVNHNKLTFSEELGDVLTEHAQKNPAAAAAAAADTFLALATVIYEACRSDRKTALSMCRRGLIHGAAEFMKHREDFTAEDCMWVLCCSPSLSLLQLLTEPRRGQAAILSVGVACCSLLTEPRQQQLALQLLDSLVSRGREVLEEAILEDSGSSVDVWADVASLCSELNRADLSRAILSVLLDQSGTRILSPDLEGARLMEHVFL